MGMDVVPTLKRPRKGTMPGNNQPPNTPRPMARKIHRVRKRSRNESFLMMPVAAAMGHFSLVDFLGGQQGVSTLRAQANISSTQGVSSR